MLFSFSLGRSKPSLIHFCLFISADNTRSPRSFEAFARICVSGLILDPEVPFRAIFDNYYPPHHHPTTTASLAHPVPPISTTHLNRKGTVLHRLRNFYGNVKRPFALSPDTPAGPNFTPSSSMGATTPASASTVTLVGPVPASRKRTDTTTSLLEKVPSSDPSSASRQHQQQEKKEVLILPFQFSVNLARRVTRRNLPYLRHSWTRTDAVSVIAFWITFVLAQTGVEHSAAHHIGVFRALSVLRIARLLSITSGTTVSDCDICVGITLVYFSFPRLSCALSRLRVRCS